ncbi:unnamed protein product [Blepharisma stoltei]|uniref:Uncharacterized protein n=1 Tax=Blepharisma stoltei TaxID=1481888 RepID=A0AAU9JZJ3_9CILI|nr:unnamed protein product [Blepharisma stoltei]
MEDWWWRGIFIWREALGIISRSLRWKPKRKDSSKFEEAKFREENSENRGLIIKFGKGGNHQECFGLCIFI